MKMLLKKMVKEKVVLVLLEDKKMEKIKKWKMKNEKWKMKNGK